MVDADAAASPSPTGSASGCPASALSSCATEASSTGSAGVIHHIPMASERPAAAAASHGLQERLCARGEALAPELCLATCTCVEAFDGPLVSGREEAARSISWASSAAVPRCSGRTESMRRINARRGGATRAEYHIRMPRAARVLPLSMVYQARDVGVVLARQHLHLAREAWIPGMQRELEGDGKGMLQASADSPVDSTMGATAHPFHHTPGSHPRARRKKRWGQLVGGRSLHGKLQPTSQVGPRRGS